MISLENDKRPIVTDAPKFNWSTNDNVRLLYVMPVDISDRLEVVGDPTGGGYEWLWRAEDGTIRAYSDAGYGSTEGCMRDGLAYVAGDADGGVTREMDSILRKLVQADQRDGLLERLKAKVASQGGECDDGDAWLIHALEEARKMVMRLNRESDKRRKTLGYDQP